MFMAYFPLYITLVLFSSHRSVWATRYLPTIVWDHLSPLLSCKCNWLVVPKVDLYDQQQFTCPTKKIYTNLLDGYFRQNTQRNENIFRRKWLGTKNDLMNNIKNESIDSFCDPTSSDTSLIYTCRDGSYSSHEVTYDYNNQADKLYTADNIYIFFNNGDDGEVSTLRSKQAKCVTFFAVYVTSNEKIMHGMDYGKPAMTISKNCKLSSCPLTAASQSIDASPTTSRTEQLNHTPSSTIQQFSSTPHFGTPSTKPNPRDLSKSSEKESRSTERPGHKKPKKTVVCIETWLNTTIFIVVVIAAFFAGIFCTIFAFATWRALKTKDRSVHDNCNNGETVGSPMYGTPPTEVPDDPQPQKESVFSRNL